MTAAATKTVTLELPQTLIDELNAIADYERQPFASVVSDILGASLPALKRQAKMRFEQAKQRLAGQSDEELQASANTGFSPKDKARAEALLAVNAERELTPAEQAELEAFYAKTETVATTRVAALWLLDRRTKAGQAAL